jgi:hypothetical protein
MAQKDYSNYERSQSIDDRLGEPDFEAWSLFDAETEKKIDQIRALHLIHRTLELPIEAARKRINRYTTVAYRLDDTALLRDAENNQHFYSEDKYFGKYYSKRLDIDEQKLDTIQRILHSPWGIYVTRDLGTSSDIVLEKIGNPSRMLRIILKEGAVRNGYIPIPSDTSGDRTKASKQQISSWSYLAARHSRRIFVHHPGAEDGSANDSTGYLKITISCQAKQ